LLEKYNNEKSRLNNLRQLQNSSSDNSNEPVDPDLIQQEVDSCTRSKKEIEEQYTKQVRDLMIEISRLKASGGALLLREVIIKGNRWNWMHALQARRISRIDSSY